MFYMGTITINIKDDAEKIFRKMAYQLYGKKKGTLGKALTEAILDWSKKKVYLDRCLDLLDKGIDMGSLKYKSRDELHGRH